MHARADGWLAHNSILLLRVSLGLVFLGFGVLKFFPGVSPAESLATRTMEAFTFGLVPAGVAIVLVACLECAIGLSFLSGRLMGTGVALLAMALWGILAPLVLFTGELFSGPAGAPTLQGQYVLKDIVLLTAGLVVAATLRGGRLLNGAEAADRDG